MTQPVVGYEVTWDSVSHVLPLPIGCKTHDKQYWSKDERQVHIQECQGKPSPRAKADTYFCPELTTPMFYVERNTFKADYFYTLI